MQNNNNVSKYFFENFKGGRGGGSNKNKNTKGNSTIYLIIFTVFKKL